MSSQQAKAYHSITIGERNTWDDWHIIPTSRPLVASPKVKTSFISLPGGDGSLDLTEVLAGRPTYDRREGSWEFIVMNDYGSWEERYSEIMGYLQGKEYDCILDDDDSYFYHGRFAVDEWRSEPYWSRIVISYTLDPYKRDVSGFGENWLWDPFNFETGIIHNYRNLIVNGSLSVIYVNEGMIETIPTITSSISNMKVRFNERTYNLSRGANTFQTLVLEPGENVLVFTGTGRVTIESIGGRL